VIRTAYADNVGKNKTAVSALILDLFAVAIVAVAIFLILNPYILKDFAYVIIAAAVLIVLAVIAIYIVIVILALPYYAAKGEAYQTDVSYDLDDVGSVKEKDSEKKGA
jgi:uncharacterized membrane protein YcjF (UPF0283 family)